MLDPKTYGDDVAQAQRDMATPQMILIASKPLTAEQAYMLRVQHFAVSPLHAFTGSEVWPEDFFLYRVAETTP